MAAMTGMPFLARTSNVACPSMQIYLRVCLRGREQGSGKGWGRSQNKTCRGQPLTSAPPSGTTICWVFAARPAVFKDDINCYYYMMWKRSSLCHARWSWRISLIGTPRGAKRRTLVTVAGATAAKVQRGTFFCLPPCANSLASSVCKTLSRG